MRLSVYGLLRRHIAGARCFPHGIVRNDTLDRIVNATAGLWPSAPGETGLPAELRDDLSPHVKAARQTTAWLSRRSTDSVHLFADEPILLRFSLESPGIGTHVVDHDIGRRCERADR